MLRSWSIVMSVAASVLVSAPDFGSRCFADCLWGNHHWKASSWVLGPVCWAAQRYPDAARPSEGRACWWNLGTTVSCNSAVIEIQPYVFSDSQQVSQSRLRRTLQYLHAVKCWIETERLATTCSSLSTPVRQHIPFLDSQATSQSHLRLCLGVQ